MNDQFERYILIQIDFNCAQYFNSSSSTRNTVNSILIANETNETHIIEPATTIPSNAKPTNFKRIELIMQSLL